MSKRTRADDLAEALTTLPWWVNVTLAAIIYISFKYIPPSIEFQNPAVKAVANALPNFAGFFAFFLLMMALISAVKAWHRGELLERQTSLKSIQELTWKEFEYLIGEAYRRQGYSVKENFNDGPDQGIDLVLSKDSEITLVQCKRWLSKKAGVSIVREHFGVTVAHKANRGIVVCSNGFTAEAENFAQKTRIELVGAKELVKLISSVQKNKNIKFEDLLEQSEIINKKDNSACPVCGSSMVIRTARRGRHKGEKFLGCSKFPLCKGTRKY